jgi:hypothetical protein
MASRKKSARAGHCGTKKWPQNAKLEKQLVLRLVSSECLLHKKGTQLMAKLPVAVSHDQIEHAVLVIRGENVLLDNDLARFYGVSTKALNQAVSRNRERFPDDFMFQLTIEEFENWRSQFVISKQGIPRSNRSQIVTGSQKHRDPRFRPYAFTEQGVAMLSSVLRSQRAVQVNIEIMRAFVRIRRILAVNAELARRLDDVELRLGNHDEQFVQVIQAIRKMMEPTEKPPRRRIGFHAPQDSMTDAYPTDTNEQPKRTARKQTRRTSRTRRSSK